MLLASDGITIGEKGTTVLPSKIDVDFFYSAGPILGCSSVYFTFFNCNAPVMTLFKFKFFAGPTFGSFSRLYDLYFVDYGSHHHNWLGYSNPDFIDLKINVVYFQREFLQISFFNASTTY